MVNFAYLLNFMDLDLDLVLFCFDFFFAFIIKKRLKKWVIWQEKEKKKSKACFALFVHLSPSSRSFVWVLCSADVYHNWAKNLTVFIWQLFNFHELVGVTWCAGLPTPLHSWVMWACHSLPRITLFSRQTPLCRNWSPQS